MLHPLTLFPSLTPATPWRVGDIQTAGPMAVVPLLGPDRPGYAGPRTGLRLVAVRGYGNVELENPSADGLAIVPLHIGYIQLGAQNHALCRSAFLRPGEKLLFEDACCVQASQGGYLKERDQWFYVLPLALRQRALELRGQDGYSKLWTDITGFNKRYGKSRHGHLEEVIGKLRSDLTRYQSRFELCPGQTGALFFLGGVLVGVEIGPSADWFAELWPALVCFAYGTEAFLGESQVGVAPSEPLRARTLPDLRDALAARRARRRVRLEVGMHRLGTQHFQLTAEAQSLGHTLSTATSRDFIGQVVHRKDGDLVWASLFAPTHRLADRIAAA